MELRSYLRFDLPRALVLLPLAVSLLGASMAVCAATDTRTPVPTLVARTANSASTMSLDGIVQPLRQATVAAQVGGNVMALLVKAGDRVRAGQPLARIDERESQAGLLRSEAGVAQADAEWRNARQQAERQRDLRGQGFVSQAALDVAETQLKAAQAGLQQAQAGRSQAALARGFATVGTPFDAVVLATHVEAGDLATPGRPVATVYAPGALRALVQVPASLSAAARAATSVQVQLPDGRIVEPTAREILPATDPVSQTVEWRLNLPATALAGAAQDQPLLPGQSVRVSFVGPASPAGTATARAGAVALTVPASALLRRGELTAVYVVREQGFVLRAVRVGADRGAAGVSILAGVQAGERLAADAVRAGLAGAVPASAP